MADSFDVALHTAPVAVGDDQTGNEVAYPGYVRTTYNDDAIFFPPCTGSTGDAGAVITHWSKGQSGKVVSTGPFKPEIALFNTGQVVIAGSDLV